MITYFFKTDKAKTFGRPAAVHPFCTWATLHILISHSLHGITVTSSSGVVVCSCCLLNKSTGLTSYDESISIHRAFKFRRSDSRNIGWRRDENFFLCFTSAKCASFSSHCSSTSVQSDLAPSPPKDESIARVEAFINSETSGFLFTK